ncbi:MAG: DNA glycosylase AlkZ-like family protein, partial [Solirubrobacteraceae bacterium]
MTVSVSWAQALAWRMRRQMLDPAAVLPADEVVRRLGGVQAQVASTAELGVRVRQASSRSGEVGDALTDERLIKTWAMRGTLHLLAPDEGPRLLSLLASGRTWELPSWQRSFGMTPRHWDLLRPAVREALDGSVLSREEL